MKISGIVMEKVKQSGTQKELYDYLVKAMSVKYSYVNFSKKMKEDRLTAEEFLYCSIYLNINLNVVQKVLKDGIKKNNLSNFDSLIDIIDMLVKDEVIYKYDGYHIIADPCGNINDRLNKSHGTIYYILTYSKTGESALILINFKIKKYQVLYIDNDYQNTFGEYGITQNYESMLSLKSHETLEVIETYFHEHKLQDKVNFENYLESSLLGTVKGDYKPISKLISIENEFCKIDDIIIFDKSKANVLV